MIIGMDWWRTASHHGYFAQLARLLLADGHQVHIISAIGERRMGTIEAEVRRGDVPCTAVHEVVFSRTMQAPELKLRLCRDLGVTVFYDDRADVCALLAGHGILAMQVPRIGKALSWMPDDDHDR